MVQIESAINNFHGSSFIIMAIKFYPRQGTLLMCDFNTGFRVPEMVKVRPVVVVSRTRGQVATVVPLFDYQTESDRNMAP